MGILVNWTKYMISCRAAMISDITKLCKEELCLKDTEFKTKPDSNIDNACNHEGCFRIKYLKGYCRTHYKRISSGISIDTPILQRRKNYSSCMECGSTNLSGGRWNKCGACYIKERRLLLKEVCLNYIGKNCRRCEKSFPTRVMNFYNPNPSKHFVSFIFRSATPEKIAEAVVDCEVLCTNCLRIATFGEWKRDDYDIGNSIILVNKKEFSNFENLRESLVQTLNVQSVKYSVVGRAKSETGKGICKAPNCVRNVRLLGLCSAHYDRVRLGISFDKPIRNRTMVSNCIECGHQTLNHIIWQRCAACKDRLRRRLLKAVCVEHKGGRCENCHGEFSDVVYDFHHLSDKDKSVGRMLCGGKPDDISAEVEKCQLVCANCHRILHADDDTDGVSE